MEKLNSFLEFNLSKFLKSKVLEVTSFKEHKRYENGKPIGVDGVVISVAIVKDRTDYGTPGISNLYQIFSIRVNGASIDDVTTRFSPGDVIRLKSYVKASVYGDYRNQLSVQCNSLSDILKGGE